MSEAGEIEMAAEAPTPVKEAVCGLLLAPSTIVRVPVMVPVVAGVKYTLTVQVPLAGTGCWQVLV